MEELPAGLYEVLVTDALKARLGALADSVPTEQRALHTAEVPDRIAWHLSRESGVDVDVTTVGAGPVGLVVPVGRNGDLVSSR